MSNRLGAHYNRYERQDVAGSNDAAFNSNDFKLAFQPNPSPLSIQQEPEIEYTSINHYVTVTSKDRDRTKYPDVSKYVVDFPYDLKNIYSIELIQAIIPDKNNITAEPYLLLKIDEVKDVMLSTDRNIADSFAILPIMPPVVPGGFIELDKRIHENTVKYFQIPKANLSRMSVSITDADGRLFDFGADTSGASPAKALQNIFVFRVVCLEKGRNVLRHRNVF